MRHIRTFVAGLCLSAVLPLVAAAQGGPPAGAPAQRQRMEQQLRQRLWRIAKERVGLNDDQMTKLEQTTAKFDERRRAIGVDDRAQRQLLRTELRAGDTANQDRVAGALDRLLQLQRQRIDLMAEEQRDLSAFMTPVQRAKFAALQEQLRRRVDTMRRSRGGPPPAR